MRSKKPDLEEVKAQFAAWRRERRGKAIPENLWKEALRLLDRYSSSTICVALGLNASRFRRVREARKVEVARVRGGRARRDAVKPRRGTLPKWEPPVSIPQAFIELPSVGVGSSGLMASPAGEMEQAGAGYRFTLENAFGRLSIVTLRSPEEELVEAVCRWALGGAADSDSGRS